MCSVCILYHLWMCYSVKQSLEVYDCWLEEKGEVCKDPGGLWKYRHWLTYLRVRWGAGLTYLLTQVWESQARITGVECVEEWRGSHERSACGEVAMMEWYWSIGDSWTCPCFYPRASHFLWVCICFVGGFNCVICPNFEWISFVFLLLWLFVV